MRATEVLQRFNVDKLFMTRFATIATSPIDQESPLRKDPSRSLFEQSSLHSSKRSAQSICPSHCFVFGRSFLEELHWKWLVHCVSSEPSSQS